MNAFLLACLLLLGPPSSPAPAVPTVQNNPQLENARGGSGLFFANSARTKRREAAEAEIKIAEKLTKDGKIGEAAAKYEALIADPQRDDLIYPEMLEGLGDLYAQQGRLREALDLYRTLVYFKPGQMWITSRSNAPDLRMKFALLLHQAGLYDEALANYNKGMEGAAKKARLMDVRLPMDPTIFSVNAQTVPTTRFLFAAHMALAACRHRFDDAECMAHLREAMKLRPNHAQPHYYLSRFLLRDEKGETAIPAKPEGIAELEKAIALDTSPSGDTRRVATALLENIRSAEEWKRVHAAKTAKPVETPVETAQVSP